MDGEREHAGVRGKDLRGAVSLVNVEIDDRDAVDAVIALEGADGDGDVVEDAEAGAFGDEGVMRTSGERAAPAMGEGFAGRGQGGTD